MSDFIEKTSPEVKWEPPVLDFTGKAYAKMMSLVSSFTTEVAWYGVVRKENDNLYHVEDVLVHPTVMSVVAECRMQMKNIANGSSASGSRAICSSG